MADSSPTPAPVAMPGPSTNRPLYTMDGDELLTVWRDRRGEAPDEELREILHHMEDAEVETGKMATNGMPFAGEVSGGGRGASLKVNIDDCTDVSLKKEYNEFSAKQHAIANELRDGKINLKDCCIFMGSFHK